jgi:spore coat polysaccharide biosynthesis protein SpsF
MNHAAFGVINQVRMTSTRLPGKALKTVLNKSLLQYQIERVRRSKLIGDLIVATTVNESGQPIVELYIRLGVKVFHGSDLDVLGRYVEPVWLAPSQRYIRITSDYPFLDPAVIYICMPQYLGGNYEYLSNSELFPNGINVEIFSERMVGEAVSKGHFFMRENI